MAQYVMALHRQDQFRMAARARIDIANTAEVSMVATTLRHGDSPVLISIDLLKTIDAERAGTWLGSAKLDGRRRLAYFDGRDWLYRAKNRVDSLDIPVHLRNALEMIPWKAGTGIDLEWTGLRGAGDAGVLYIFDVLYVDGSFCQWPFVKRVEWLRLWSQYTSLLVQFAQHKENPGLFSLFQEQLCNPLSEGIVAVRADSTLIGNRERSVESPHCFKVKFTRMRLLACYGKLTIIDEGPNDKRHVVAVRK